MRVIENFDNAMTAFHYAVKTRLSLALGMSNHPLQVETKPTDYVVTGLVYELRDPAESEDSDKIYRFWLGANFEKLFFIARFQVQDARAKNIFKNTFDAAAKEGWNVYYQPVGDEEVSIWATLQAPSPLVVVKDSEHGDGDLLTVTPGQFDLTGLTPDERLTREGGRWAIDIAMMVQSMVRTAQRESVYPSRRMPAPL